MGQDLLAHLAEQTFLSTISKQMKHLPGVEQTERSNGCKPNISLLVQHSTALICNMIYNTLIQLI
jgi:hypothetical protein